MCPECGAQLVTLELRGMEVDYCFECGGTWLDAGELAMIVELAGVKVENFGGKLYSTKASGPGKGRCPRCKRKLKSVVVPGKPDVVLDRCPAGHGLYFDKGEMLSVVKCLAGDDDKVTGIVAEFLGDMFKFVTEGKGGGECG